MVRRELDIIVNELCFRVDVDAEDVDYRID